MNEAVVLTPEREVAQLWQSSSDPLSGWRRLRKFTPRIERTTISVDGRVYDRTSDQEIAHFLHDLIRDWRRPDSTIVRAQKAEIARRLQQHGGSLQPVTPCRICFSIHWLDGSAWRRRGRVACALAGVDFPEIGTRPLSR